MIEWLGEHPWLIEAIVTIVTASIVMIAVCYWVDHFRGD